MQCTTADAPMNWDDPGAGDIELALVRQPATGQRLGSLLINPGGPGGSGYDFVHDSIDYATSERLQQSFDIVGFDPRGVGHSSAVSCYDDPAYLDDYNYGIMPGEYGSDEWIANLAQARTRSSARRASSTPAPCCSTSTPSAPRATSTCCGRCSATRSSTSSATRTARSSARPTPTSIPRRPAASCSTARSTRRRRDFDVTAHPGDGLRERLPRLPRRLHRARGMPVHVGHRERDGEDRRPADDSLRPSPLTGEDGRMLGASAMFIAIILPLYNHDNWPYLDQLFAEVFERGDRHGVPPRRQLQRPQPRRHLRRQLDRGVRLDQLPRLRQRLLDRDDARGGGRAGRARAGVRSADVVRRNRPARRGRSRRRGCASRSRRPAPPTSW